MTTIYRQAAAVTPHDANPLPEKASQLYVGGAGNVVAVINDEDVTFAGVPAGTFLPVRVSQVKATGTTATNIVALW